MNKYSDDEKTRIFKESMKKQKPYKEPEPVHIQKNGQWTGTDIKSCSICGNEAYWDTDYGQQLFDYCPYCGSRMSKS